MVETFALDLASPEKLLLSQNVEMVVLPAEEGDLGVLPGHTSVIAALRSGVLCIFTKGKVTERIFVDGGFLEITPERCTVLTESAFPLTDADPAVLRRDVTRHQEIWNTALDDDTRAAAAQALHLAERKLAAVENPAYA